MKHQAVLPRPGERVKIDYPGYVLHGRSVEVVSCAVARPEQNSRRRPATPPPFVVFQNPLAPGVQIGLPLHRVHRT